MISRSPVTINSYRYPILMMARPSALGETLRRSALITPAIATCLSLTWKTASIITMHVDSIAIDPLVGILAAGSEFGEFVEDDDSGGGLLGLNAELHFKATQAGTHLILVEDAFAEVAGGYILTVKPGRHRTRRPSPRQRRRRFRWLSIHQWGQCSCIAVLRPTSASSIRPSGRNNPRNGVKRRAFASEQGGLFGITEHDLVVAGLGRMDCRWLYGRCRQSIGKCPDY